MVKNSTKKKNAAENPSEAPQPAVLKTTRSNLVLVVIGVFAALVQIAFKKYYYLQAASSPKASEDFGGSAELSLRSAFLGDNKQLARWNSHKFNSSMLPMLPTLPTWGSYRPQIYFGLKTRTSPTALSSGIMWALNHEAFRHDTSQDEVVFDWDVHDGSGFGIEVIKDLSSGFDINASFISDSAALSAQRKVVWIQRFDINPTKVQREAKRRHQIRFLHYLGFEGDVSGLSPLSTTIVTAPQYSDKIFIVGNSSIAHAANQGGSGLFVIVFQIIVPSHEAPVANSAGTQVPQVSFIGLSNRTVADGVLELKAQSTRTQRHGKNSRSHIFSPQGDFVNKTEEGNTFLAISVRSSGEPFRVHMTMIEGFEGMSRLDLTESIQNGNADFLSMHLPQDSVDDLFRAEEERFDQRFSDTFKLHEKTNEHGAQEFSDDDIRIARRVLSSMLGGIGHFYGQPLVVDDTSSNARSTFHAAPISLLTATPSRTSFPRGFLWDEGFHQLLISRWDLNISFAVIRSWLSAQYHFSTESNDMNATATSSSDTNGGWIPREMILGAESARRVPSEFVLQRTDIANPPALILVIEHLLDQLDQCSRLTNCPMRAEETHRTAHFLEEIFPMLESWMKWFLWSQRGPIHKPGSFRWRGREFDENRLLTNTLASGLDDYPRSPVPSTDEYHLDLHIWIAKFSSVMSRLSTRLKRQGDTNQASPDLSFHDLHLQISSRTDELHWSETHQAYLDVGLHDESMKFSHMIKARCINRQTNTAKDVLIKQELFQRIPVNEHCPREFPTFAYPYGDGRGGLMVVDALEHKNLTLQHIPHDGYVSIFPFLLTTLPASSPRLSKILDVIEDPRLLWTDYGLRSLSSKDKFYRVSNAHGDDPYWRGPIWINVNYLALRALNYYSRFETDQQQRIKHLYKQLRTSLQRNILNEYKRTGYLWEQYSEVDGHGMRGHPFSGWTALVLNIMSEKY